MSLPTEPESWASIKARFPKALEKIWDADAIAFAFQNNGDRPGLHRTHVFDFEDGIRMMASMEKKKCKDSCKHPEKHAYVHLSFSGTSPAPTLYNPKTYTERIDFLVLAFAGHLKLTRTAATNIVLHFEFEPPKI